MLRSAGIRSKILAVLVVPLVLLGITTGLLATSQVAQARQAYQVEKIAAIGGPFGELVRGIAAERALTAAALQDDPAATEALPGVRAQVDGGLAASREAVADIEFGLLSQQAEDALARVETAHVQLGIVRATVDRGGASVDDVMDGYGDVLREDLAMPGRVAAGVDDPRTADLLTGFGHLLTTRDLALREQEVGLRILARTATAGDGATFATLAPAQEEEIARWQFAVGSTSADDAAALVGRQTRTVWSIGRGRVALSSPSTVGQTGLTPELWSDITGARVAALDTALAEIAAQVDTEAAAASRRATVLAAAVAAAAVLGVGVTVLLSLVLARRISRPLRELTAAATSVREQLPVMVEQMRSPGQMPDVQLPHIDVVGDDEVGRLAAAFNDVNDTVVRVAEEQAALRGSIAETFVNVARRNQVLLSRQLSFIDQLEQREENPDTLENLFRLDHLATRMRRNAESLLVLANIDAGRRLRQPLALSDVIRTAASEIEQYQRVNLALQVDPPTMGHLSLQLAHLLAELLENGTNFSEPHTPVLVATSRTASGVRITVTDEGLGLTDDEIETARAKISDFAADDVVTSQRLGFFVVGRLARRLGVTVSVRRGSAKGLVVTVDLPPSVFVPGTVTASSPAVDAATTAGALPAGPAAPTGPTGPTRSETPQAPAPTARPQVPAARTAAPTARPEAPSARPAARPAPSRPAAPARPSGASIPMPGQVPDATPAPAVSVTPGGATLPRRGQSAPAAVAAVDPSSPAAPAAPVAPEAAPLAAPVAHDPGSSLPAPSVVPPASVGSLDEPPALSPVVAQGSSSLPSRSRRAAATDAPVSSAPGSGVSSSPAPVSASSTAALTVPAPQVPAARTAPAAPAPEPSTARTTPATAHANVAPGFADLLAASDPTALPEDADHASPPRRAGLFGAFRARREDGGPGMGTPTPTGGVPAPRPGPDQPVDPSTRSEPATPPVGAPGVAEVPSPAQEQPGDPFPVSMAARATLAPSVIAPPVHAPAAHAATEASPAAAPHAPAEHAPVPHAPAVHVAVPPASLVPPAAVPPVAPPVAPAAAPAAAPAVAPVAVPVVPPAATPRPASVPASPPASPPVAAPAPAPEPEQAPLLAAPVSILPGGTRRRGRRSLFGGHGRSAESPVTAPAPTASLPTVPTAPAVPLPAPVHDPSRPATSGAAPAAPSLSAPARGFGGRPLEPTPGPSGAPLPARTGGQGQPAASGPLGTPPAAAGPALPSRTAPERAPAPAPPGGAPVVPALADGEAVRQRSMLASEALSELSRLSSYSPSTVEGRGGPAALVRRQPAATEAARIPPPAPPAADRRQRSAADVRSMLSGFQSGVTRGRAEDADGETGGTPAPVDPGTAPTGTAPPTTTRTTDSRTTDSRTTDSRTTD